ncbi:hypothetical protein CM19_01430 [Candidatus Acidianus copahuensis]|uniref:Uncharacterized protein n=1 Tax=Candidatus Acidianus copahuensis TaxID=1160895 RepID=A0A031LUD8_9CREN|nr:hypothetical protein CM19_01430 [Candidatus Acidianus copahuensis]
MRRTYYLEIFKLRIEDIVKTLKRTRYEVIIVKEMNNKSLFIPLFPRLLISFGGFTFFSLKNLIWIY